MEFMKKLSETIGRFMAVLILVVAGLALFVPKTGLWIDTSWITYLLMAVMFGMGMTMKFSDFKVVFSHPKDILIGSLTQFIMMPLLAFFIGKAFGLETGLLAGLILVGTCPGGTASNVMTYLAKGDVPLSVGMTSVNTLLAPILTPAITYLLLHTTVSVDMKSMFISIVKVVIVPIALGLLANKLLGKHADDMKSLMPMVSVLAITMIVSSVVSHNSAMILSTGPVIFVTVILLNLLGYAGGYMVGSFTGMPLSKRKALAIEIGMQNSGLAASLAATAFPSLAMVTVPGAVFSIWHNISGAVLANILKNVKEKNAADEQAAAPITVSAIADAASKA